MREDNTTIADRTRNYGIDLLRVIAMVYVVVLHSLGHGGVLESVTYRSSNYYLAYGLEIWCYCAVDVFAIISGYLGYSSKQENRFSKYFQLWVQVVFYSILLLFATSVITMQMPTKISILQSMTPITSHHYWYFRAYTGVFLFMPIINGGIESLDLKQAKTVLVVIVLIISGLSIYAEPFELQDGYEFAWIAIMYCLGAIIKKIDMTSDISNLTASIITIVLYAVTCMIHFLQDEMGDFFGEYLSLTSYLSPTIIIIAIMHLALFDKIKINSKIIIKKVKFLSAGAFSVYIINDNDIFREVLIEDRFAVLSQRNSVTMTAVIIIGAIMFSLACMLIDGMRRAMFKAVGIDAFSYKAQTRIYKLLDKTTRKI